MIDFVHDPPTRIMIWSEPCFLVESTCHVMSMKRLRVHVPSPGLQSIATGQSLPFPDFGVVAVKVLSAAFSQAAVQVEYVPSQSISTQKSIIKFSNLHNKVSFYDLS